jgi:hypothetical protein
MVMIYNHPLAALRCPGGSYSDVILRLAKQWTAFILAATTHRKA